MNPDIRALLLSLLCGAVLMLAWDVLHALRRVFFRGIITNLLLDIVWWVFAAAAVVGCTWYANHMDLRFFIWGGLGIGALLYHITLSGAFRSLFYGIFDIILKIIKFIFKILLTPGLFLYKILLRNFKRGGADEGPKTNNL